MRPLCPSASYVMILLIDGRPQGPHPVKDKYIDFNHLPLTTEDGTQLNLDTLYKIAPSCFNSILKAWVKG